MSTIEHTAPNCRGVIVVRYRGRPSTERVRVTTCLGCGAELVEPASPRVPAGQLEDGGCDR